MKTVDFKNLIVLENDDFMVINKPSGIPSLDDRTGEGISIIRLAKEYWPDAQIGHRLDKETSGILALAKNPEAYRHISMQFEHREVKKVYHAVADGIHKFDNLRVNLPILPLSGGAVKIDRAKGKPAETFFTSIQVFARHTLIECLPVTGRMHQIRIHLSQVKAPIVCDPQYGGSMVYLSELKKRFNLKKDTEEFPLIQRVALHAWSLEFKSMSGEPIKAEATYPKDFSVLVKQLEKHS
ncbi:MAG: RluA family pseudouridine synthase [Cytophagaceae bacterium]